MAERELRHGFNEFLESLIKRKLTEEEVVQVRIKLKKILTEKTKNQKETLRTYEKTIASLKAKIDQPKKHNRVKPKETGYWG